jgi:hypothetical protein
MNIAALPADHATPTSELEPIAILCDGTVRYVQEAARNYIHMISLHFYVRGTETHMDALLCLNYPNGNYPTKLYLPTNIGLGLNWNETAFILARAWHSWSWKGVAANQSPIAILAGHLEAFR